MQNLFNGLSVTHRIHHSLIYRMVSLDGVSPTEQAVRPSPTAATTCFGIATGAHHGCSLLTATFEEMGPTLLPICDHSRAGEIAGAISGFPSRVQRRGTAATPRRGTCCADALFGRDAGRGGRSYVCCDMTQVLDIDPRTARRCLHAGLLHAGV
jgi:hypothetical protein